MATPRQGVYLPSKIEVSTGLAAFDREKMKSASDMIQAADAELYKMKGGRKR
jgi:PleD family two-component response regulator